MDRSQRATTRRQRKEQHACVQRRLAAKAIRDRPIQALAQRESQEKCGQRELNLALGGSEICWSVGSAGRYMSMLSGAKAVSAPRSRIISNRRIPVSGTPMVVAVAKSLHHVALGAPQAFRRALDGLVLGLLPRSIRWCEPGLRRARRYPRCSGTSRRCDSWSGCTGQPSISILRSRCSSTFISLKPWRSAPRRALPARPPGCPIRSRSHRSCSRGHNPAGS